MKERSTLVGSVLASRATWAAVAVLALGWLPLIAVGLFGEPDANPIGLGLLAFLATPVAGLLAIVGLFRGVQRHRAG